MLIMLKRFAISLTIIILLFNFSQAKKIIVKGKGVPPSKIKTAAQGRLMAERAAKVNGYRKIIDRLHSRGVSMKRTKKGILIKGMRIIQTTLLKDGTVEVVMVYHTKDR